MRITTLSALVIASATILTGQTESATVSGHISISTSSSRRTSVVTIRAKEKQDIQAMFCISYPQPLAEKLTYAGPGKVVYRPRPIPGLPAGVKISGPETIAPVLAVLPAEGKALLFRGEGESSPLPAADLSMKSAATFQVATIVRQDWRASDGARRGTSEEACLAPGG